MTDFLMGRGYTNVDQLTAQFGLTRVAAITLMKEFVNTNPKEFKFYSGRIGIPSCVVRIAAEFGEALVDLTSQDAETIPKGSIVGVKLHSPGLYEVYWGGVCTYATTNQLKI